MNDGSGVLDQVKRCSFWNRRKLFVCNAHVYFVGMRIFVFSFLGVQSTGVVVVVRTSSRKNWLIVDKVLAKAGDYLIVPEEQYETLK